MALPPRTVILGSPPSPTHKVDPLELADLLETMNVDAEAAQTAAIEAASARDAAFVNADVYADIATGRAAVADGEQFMVVDGSEIVRYRRDTSTTQTEMARYYNTEGVDDPQRNVWGVFFYNPHYEQDGTDLYVKPMPYGGGSNVAYIRGGFLPNAAWTYADILADLAGMATPSGSALGVTSPSGVTDCIRLSGFVTLYYDIATASWGWASRAAQKSGRVKVIENNGDMVAASSERPEALYKLAKTEITKTRTEHLTPIISATGYPPNIDTVANTLTFTIDTLVMHRNVSYRVDATTAIDLTTVASTTKVVYMDLRDKSFVLRAYNSAFTEVEKQFFVLLAVIRYSVPNVHMAISCQYTVDGRSPWAGLDAKQVEWAAIFTPLNGSPTPTTNLPNYDTATDTLTFYPDTIFASGDNRWVLSSGASITLSGSSANRIFWDTATSTLVFKAWSSNLTRAEAAKYVLVAAIRDGTAAGVPPVISMMCPYTVDGKLLGYIADYAAMSAENRAGAALEGIMHRGYSATSPENTLAAYKAAAGVKNYTVEGDIRWTSDNVAVLLHDSTIDRTSDGTGAISGMTLATAKTYDFGSWKSSAYTGEEIPTWDEFLILAKKLDLFGYFEIKIEASVAQIQGLIASVAKAGMKGRVQFDSFSLTNIQKVVAEDATQDVGYLVGELTVDADWTTAVANAAALLGGNNRVAIEPPLASLTKARVEEAHEAGLRVVVYTINSASDVYTLADMGVDGIMTDALNIAQVIRDNEL